MKHITKPLLLIVLGISIFSCRAQMVQTPADAPKIELNKQQFIEKPLKNLLKEIKPKIKSALIASHDEENYTSYYFSFVSRKKSNELNRAETPAVTIQVYTRGGVNVDYRKRRNSGMVWTPEDERMYGNCIIIGIEVYGDPKYVDTE